MHIPITKTYTILKLRSTPMFCQSCIEIVDLDHTNLFLILLHAYKIV